MLQPGVRMRMLAKQKQGGASGGEGTLLSGASLSGSGTEAESRCVHLKRNTIEYTHAFMPILNRLFCSMTVWVAVFAIFCPDIRAQEKTDSLSSLSGILIARYNLSVNDATVFLKGEKDQFAVVTGMDGTFSFPHIKSGKWVLSVKHVKFEPYEVLQRKADPLTGQPSNHCSRYDRSTVRRSPPARRRGCSTPRTDSGSPTCSGGRSRCPACSGRVPGGTGWPRSWHRTRRTA